jgi:thiaminase
MVEFVDWLRDSIDKLYLTNADQENARKIFKDILRYELMFWEMAVNDEVWI